MNTYIYHMVDAALLLCFGSTRILVDGVHEGQRTGFSAMPQSVESDLNEMRGIYAGLGAALFTHLHPDHFEQKRLTHLIEHTENLAVYGPELSGTNVHFRTISDDLCSFAVNDIEVMSVRSTHDGELFGNDPHRILFLDSGNEAFMIGGDALLRREELDAYRAKIPTQIAAAFVNPYQAGTPAGREYLKVLQPERIFLYHLPLPEDDKDNYWLWSRSILRQWPEELAPLEVLEPMRWIDGRMPDTAV